MTPGEPTEQDPGYSTLQSRLTGLVLIAIGVALLWGARSVELDFERLDAKFMWIVGHALLMNLPVGGAVMLVMAPPPRGREDLLTPTQTRVLIGSSVIALIVGAVYGGLTLG